MLAPKWEADTVAELLACTLSEMAASDPLTKQKHREKKDEKEEEQEDVYDHDCDDHKVEKVVAVGEEEEEDQL